MRQVSQFFNTLETSYGPNTLKDGCKPLIAVSLIPIVSMVLGIPIIVGLIKNGPSKGNKIQFAVDLVAGILMTLGLGFLLLLTGALVSLGKKLKQVCSSPSLKD